MDLGDRVLRSAPRAEAIRTWLEVRLKDRLEHQFQRGLHDPVIGSRDPQPPDLARRLGDHLLPHPLGDKPASLEIISQPVEHHPSPGTNGARCHSINPGGPCALVDPHPVPGHDQEGRVINQIGEVIETTARISHRPSVQLLLHHKYPVLGLVEVGPRIVGIHRRTPRSAPMLRTRWTPSPCDRLSRPRTTTGPPPHPCGISRRQAFPPTIRLMAGEGTAGMVPTFTIEPLDGVGAQLCPCNIATATPQAFTVASRLATSPSQGVFRTASSCECALLTSPDLPDSSWRVS